MQSALFADLFILVAGGIVVGFMFIGCEIMYKRRHDTTIRKRQLALHYGRLWRQRSTSKKSRDSFDHATPPTGATNLQLPSETHIIASDGGGGGWTSVIPFFRQPPGPPQPAYYLEEQHQRLQLLPQPHSMVPPIVWDTVEGPVRFEIPEIHEADDYAMPDGAEEAEEEEEAPDARYGAIPIPQQQHPHSSPHSQDERLAYRPRRAIIV